MAEFIFFQKRKKVVVLHKTDYSEITLLLGQGYVQQIEEISSQDAEKALMCFLTIRQETLTSE